MTDAERIQRAKEISFQLLRRMRDECSLKTHKVPCTVHRPPDDETDKEDRIKAGEIVDRMVREGTLWKR